MAVNIRVLNESYKTITLLVDVDESADSTSLLLDADDLDFYDTDVPGSSDIKLGLSSAFWNLSGDADNSGGRLTLAFNHKTTDAVLLTLTGSGQVNFTHPLTVPSPNPSGQSETNFNGDINYSVEGNTAGHAVLTFSKVSGYRMAWKGWKKPTQKIN